MEDTVKFACAAMLANLLIIPLMFVGTAAAQNPGGTISGVVSDPSGAVLQGTKVTVTNVNTGVAQTTSSNETGLYTVIALEPGQYEIQASHAGFQTVVRKGVVLLIDQQSRQDLVLAVGTSTQSVTVTATTAQFLEPESSDLHQVIEGDLTLELPLNGRNINQLITLDTGVTTTTASFFKGVGVDLAINGQRSSTNAFLIDGLDNVEFMSQAPNITLEPDAVQEFDVMTNTFSAEYGRSDAGVINVATRSGTNQLHGDLFEFVRNDALDANDFFSNRYQIAKLPFQFNQFGASLGGPIRKNKIFYFGAYQGTLTRTSSTNILSVPPVAWRTGDFSSLLAEGIQLYDPTTVTGTDSNGLPIRAPFVGNQISMAKQDSAGRNLLALYPAPNQPGDDLNYVTPLKTADNDHQGNLKVDYAATSKDTVSGRWNIEDSDNLSDPDFGNTGGGGALPIDHVRSQDAAGTYVHTFKPNLLNTAAYGYLRQSIQNLPSGYGLELNQQVGIGGSSTLPTASGLASINPDGWDGLGGQVFFPQIVTIQTHEIMDNLTWMRGRHSIKIGGDYDLRLLSLFQAGFPRGYFGFDPLITGQEGLPSTGNAIASLLMGFPDFGQQDYLNHFIDQSGNEFSAYLQDDYRVSRKLTLNLGIRYDLYTPQVEAQNRQANFDMTTKTLLLAGQNGNSRGLVDTDYHNVGPRVGFAYSPFSNNKTVIRGGYGIFYMSEQNALATLNRLAYNIPFYYLQTVPQVGLFNPFFSLSGGLPAIPTPDPTQPFGTVQYRVPGLHDSMVHSWNLDVQHEVMADTLLDVAYAGSRGVGILAIRNPNQPPAGPVQVYPVSPNIGLLFTMTNDGESDYDALQVKLNRRFSHGLTFLGSYTYSHSIDNGPGYWPNSGISQLPQDSLHPNNGERGSSDWDIRQNFIFSTDWQIPVGRGRKFLGDSRGVVDQVLGGWQMTGILGLASGTPFTPYITLDQANTAYGGDLRPNIIRNPAVSHPNADQWFNTSAYAEPALFTYGDASRNTLVGPGLRNLDMGLYKNFRLSESFRLQFRAEFFNLTNTAHFGLPNPFVDIPQGGTITTLTTPPRNVQLALKLNF
ncbi:MAG: carboxypeptidase regulatory-like domain-containing protein [Methanoregula sp.]